MSKWEYRILDSKDIEGGGIFKGTPRENTEAYLTALGNDRWEICHLQFNHVEQRYKFYGIAKREVRR